MARLLVQEFGEIETLQHGRDTFQTQIHDLGVERFQTLQPGVKIQVAGSHDPEESPQDAPCTSTVTAVMT